MVLRFASILFIFNLCGCLSILFKILLLQLGILRFLVILCRRSCPNLKWLKLPWRFRMLPFLGLHRLYVIFSQYRKLWLKMISLRSFFTRNKKLGKLDLKLAREESCLRDQCRRWLNEGDHNSSLIQVTVHFCKLNKPLSSLPMLLILMIKWLDTTQVYLMKLRFLGLLMIALFLKLFLLWLQNRIIILFWWIIGVWRWKRLCLAWMIVVSLVRMGFRVFSFGLCRISLIRIILLLFNYICFLLFGTLA